jgi:hypothetical protein
MMKWVRMIIISMRRMMDLTVTMSMRIMRNKMSSMRRQ